MSETKGRNREDTNRAAASR